jgi:two-component system OmpR family response regulator
MDLDTSILIVDDDDGIRGLISDFLQKHGYRTDTAADAPMMRHAAQQRYDLIVLDVMMPREDGLTALRQLGSDAPPVIMLSAVGSDIDRIVGLEMGADDYLPNPVTRASCWPASARCCAVRHARSATGQTTASEAAPAEPARRCCISPVGSWTSACVC